MGEVRTVLGATKNSRALMTFLLLILMLCLSLNGSSRGMQPSLDAAATIASSFGAGQSTAYPAIHVAVSAASFGEKREDMVGIFSIQKQLVLASGSPGSGENDPSSEPPEAGRSDGRVGPRLVSLVIEPDVANLTRSDLAGGSWIANLTVVIDRPARTLLPGTARFVSPSKGSSSFVALTTACATIDPVNESSCSVLRGAVTIPEGSEAGRWTLVDLRLTDIKNHTVLLGPDEIEAGRFDGFIDVIG
jgi:hypothetical protein